MPVTRLGVWEVVGEAARRVVVETENEGWVLRKMKKGRSPVF